mgnify:CR=1 FL=1
MKLPEYVDVVLEKLNSDGFEAFAVGGCVRDSILGIAPKDYDVTTNATPEQIKRCFSGFRTIDTGIEFGTVTVISDGFPIEVTTYRIDGEYNDNRRPDSVEFTSDLSEDLRRRDFTINAMAFNKKTGIIDLYGGKADLSERVIRAIGEPVERFNEDGLRIMRALRFASCYNFSIESGTAEAIHSKACLLENIAKERIAIEFNKFICGNCESLLREYNDVFSILIPEIKKCIGFEQRTKYHNRDVYEHIITTVSASEPIKHLRLAMLLHDIGKPDYFTIDEKGQGHFKGHAVGSCQIAEKFLKTYRYDNETAHKVIELIKNHDIVIENNEKQIKRYLNRFGVELFYDIIDVHIADDTGKSPDFQHRIEVYKEVKDTVKRIISENECFSFKDLAVNGNDMTELGYKGKAIGDILSHLLDKVIDGEIPNEKEILINEAKKNGGAEH